MAFFMLQSTSMKTESLSVAAAIQEWLDAESKSFTAIAGESFSHAEVIATGAFSLSLVPAICLMVHIVSWLAGGAA